MKNLQNSVLTITMAIGLAITGLTPAHASAPTTISIAEPVQASSTTEITAAPVTFAFERTAVTTTAAPVAAVVPTPVAYAAAEIVQPQTSESVSPVAKTVAAPAVAVPALQTSTPVSGNAIAAAALAQLGRAQDCTMLVTNSLAAVGIHFHGWPADYISLGHIVPESAAQPGDLIYYANGGSGMAHIAVYIGGGKAVHGGFNGNSTVIFSVNVGTGHQFIHIG